MLAPPSYHDISIGEKPKAKLIKKFGLSDSGTDVCSHFVFVVNAKKPWIGNQPGFWFSDRSPDRYSLFPMTAFYFSKPQNGIQPGFWFQFGAQ